MQRDAQRDLEILTELARGEPVTQRELAQKLGVALGLANLYVKRLAKKGLIKIVEFPRKPAAKKRLRYLLTPKGIAEKTRLTYDHAAYALNLYRRTRQTLRESLNRLPANGLKRIALYGTGEAAELAYLTLKEFGLDPLGIFAPQPGDHFLGFPVRAVGDLAGEEFDCLVLATFDRPEPHVAELKRLGIPAERILTLRRMLPEPAGPGATP